MRVIIVGAGVVGAATAYSVSADGGSFLVIRDVERGSTKPKITIVENWFAEFAPSTPR